MSETDPDQQELRRLGRSIRQIRIEQGISMAALASASEADTATIEALEAGQLDPSFDLMLDIAKALGVEMAAIVIRTEQVGGEGDAR